MAKQKKAEPVNLWQKIADCEGDDLERAIDDVVAGVAHAKEIRHQLTRKGFADLQRDLAALGLTTTQDALKTKRAAALKSAAKLAGAVAERAVLDNRPEIFRCLADAMENCRRPARRKEAFIAFGIALVRLEDRTSTSLPDGTKKWPMPTRAEVENELAAMGKSISKAEFSKAESYYGLRLRRRKSKRRAEKDEKVS